MAGVGLTYAFFVAAYLVLPATRVRPWPAVGGGIVAGTAFELAKGIYAWAATHLFRFQAVYGSIAAVFVFLLWIYLSWTIFLFGARLAFVLQHHRALVEQEEQGNAMGRELLAVRALLEVALCWWDGTRSPDAGEVADRIDAAAEPVRDVLSLLEEAGLLNESDDGRLAPARPLDKTTLADVRRVIAGPPPRARGGWHAGDARRAPGRGGRMPRSKGSPRTTFADLCRAVRNGQPPPIASGAAVSGGASARIPV